MIKAYGVSLPGTYHIKNEIVCQDYHEILLPNKQVAIAAVADGLGSAEHSDIASKLAATVATEHCKHNIKSAKKVDDILNVIRASFHAAYRAIETEVSEKEHDLAQYDTTLSLAIMLRDTLFYGHSGDSGIIALTTGGRYEAVTQQQRDEQGRVFPLYFTDKWEFGKFEPKVSAVLLSTDGIYEIFFPIYIRNDPTNNIHVNLAQFFMDNTKLSVHKRARAEVEADITEFLKSIPDEQVNDDKTVVVLINTAIKAKLQPKEYYEEPDWAELKKEYDEAWRREAYPGLFKNNEQDDTPPPPPTENPIEENLPIEKPEFLKKSYKLLLRNFIRKR